MIRMVCITGRSRDINAPKVDFFQSFLVFWGINISASTPPTDMKLAPKCLFSWVLRNDIEFYLRGGTEKKSENQNLPPCFEKVFFRKISVRGLQWHISPLYTPYGVGEINVWKFTDRDTTLSRLSGKLLRKVCYTELALMDLKGTNWKDISLTAPSIGTY